MKLKNILQGKVFQASAIAVLGAWMSLLLCASIGESGTLKRFFPFWLFVFFTVFDIVIGKLKFAQKSKWLKAAAFAAAGAAVLLLLAILNALEGFSLAAR